ncbi:pyridoxal phosphate-dependent aminotransferase [Actinomadura luteofluorescens]|uniref:pyridoxal phosphate-dependent aminotransferase n=1 Tax=Actinomadura luteofluorescens TaxID=46163 RepID=UPI0030CDAB01
MTVQQDARPHTLAGGRLRPAISFEDERFLMFVLDEMAGDYEQRYDDVIRLTLGKSELPPEEPIIAAMLDAAEDYAKASLVFPGGLPQLRHRLSAEYRSRYGVEVPAERFVVSVGTSMAFRNLTQLLAGPGDEVVVPLPYYPLYPFTARLAGARVRHYRIDLDTLQVDLDSLAEAMSERTRIVVVNSPGNPLGNVIDPATFRRIDEIVGGRAVVIADEIYNNVHFDDEPYSAVTLAGEMTSPLVVTNAFSKAHRMYARRVGYAIVPDELVRPLTVIQHHTLLTTDPVPQFGAIAALDHQEGVRELTGRYGARRDYTLERFGEVSAVRAVPARGSFYLTLDCAEYLRRHDIPGSLALAERIMRATRVATVPGSDFGLPDTLRLSYTSARYEEGIDRLAGFFTGAPPDDADVDADVVRQG